MKAFLAQGDRVAGISRSGEAPDGALGLAADVTDPDALAQALSAATGPGEAGASASGRAASAISRHRRRKEALVTPAMGASSTGVGTSSAPMRSGTGERSEVPASWEEGAVSVVVTPPCWHTVGTRVPIHTWSEPRGHRARTVCERNNTVG